MDILESEKRLKKMPYSTPEGYFAELQHKVLSSARQQSFSIPERRPAWKPLRYFTAAAMLAAVVTGGIAIADNILQTRQQEEMIDESFFYTELLPATGVDILYETDNDGYIAGTDLSDEDIIDYLIYTGTPVELLNESDYDE